MEEGSRFGMRKIYCFKTFSNLLEAHVNPGADGYIDLGKKQISYLDGSNSVMLLKQHYLHKTHIHVEPKQASFTMKQVLWKRMCFTRKQSI